MRLEPPLCWSLVALLVGGSLLAQGLDDPPGALRPTYTRDTAPILLKHCVPCHRPGQVAPFSLLTYEDASRRGRQIVQVTETGYMPPWKPVEGHGEFLDERRLSPAELATLRRWVAAGTPRGDPAHLPPAPRFARDWQLGEPDLVVSMPRPYTVPASGQDVFRNFVLPVELAAGRYVRALELRAETPRVMHHATVLVDSGGTARSLDAADEEVGFAGMLWSGEINPPDGHFLGWTPGRVPRELPAGTYWRLDPGMDLVLETHLLPTGKPEPFNVSVGLFFTSESPSRRPVMVRLGSESLDIPPGAAAYEVQDSFVLPVDAQAVMLYPHAHYLGRRIEGWATLPDGSRQPLILIDDWDFNWQDSYHFAKPLELPARSRLEARFVYDNTAANVTNPHQPPRRVLFGPRSWDEMGDLWLQLLPARPEERQRLHHAAQRHRADIVMAGARMRLRLDREDADAHTVLADLLARLEQPREAVEHYRRAVTLRPESVPAHNNLAAALVRLGLTAEAVTYYRKALELDPDSAQVHVNLASALAAQGRLDEAEGLLEEALRLDPKNADAHLNLGSALTDRGRPAEGLSHLQAALRLKEDESAIVHYNLGNAHARLGEVEEALKHYRETLRLDPFYASAHNNLGTLLGSRGRLEEAVTHFQAAVKANPDHFDARNNLGAILASWGRVPEALEHLRAALRLRPQSTSELAARGREHFARSRLVHAIAHHEAALARDPTLSRSWRELALARHRLGHAEEAMPPYRRRLALDPQDLEARRNLVWILATHPDPRLRNGKEAVELLAGERNFQDPVTLDVLAAAYAEAGRFDEALQVLDEALAAWRERGDDRETLVLSKRRAGYSTSRAFRDETGTPPQSAQNRGKPLR